MGMTRWFGIKLPVMMGVTFAAVGPMVAFANAQPGVDGARAIFGAIIGAGIISVLIAPLVSRMLRFFPPVVTGTIITIIGVSLMRVGVGWAMGGPAFLAQRTDVPKLVEMVDRAKASAAAASAPITLGPIPMLDNPAYGALDNMAIAAFVLVMVLLLVKYTKGFIANISVLLGIVAGCALAIGMGKMNFDKVGQGALVRCRHALRLRPAHLRHRHDPDDGAGDDRGDDRIDRHVPGAVRHHRQEDHAARTGGRVAHRRPGHA